MKRWGGFAVTPILNTHVLTPILVRNAVIWFLACAKIFPHVGGLVCLTQWFKRPNLRTATQSKLSALKVFPKVARHSITSLAEAEPCSLHGVGNVPFKEHFKRETKVAVAYSKGKQNQTCTSFMFWSKCTPRVLWRFWRRTWAAWGWSIWPFKVVHEQFIRRPRDANLLAFRLIIIQSPGKSGTHRSWENNGVRFTWLFQMFLRSLDWRQGASFF